MKGYDDVLFGNLSLLKHKIANAKRFPIRCKIIGNKKKAVFYFHGWGSSSNVFSYMANQLKKDYTIVLIDYPYEILSSDTKKTVRYFSEILIETKKIIKKYKFTEINLFGTSLGGFISIYIAKRIKINKIVLSVAGSKISDVIWTGIVGKRIKDALLIKGYDLKKLRKDWKTIDPINNISKNNVLAYTSVNDRIVLYKYQEELSKSLLALEIKEKRFGHEVTAGKNLIDYNRLMEFLKND